MKFNQPQVGDGERSGEASGNPLQHDVVWTPDRIQRFWNFHSASDALAETYFSKMRGQAILDFVSKRVRIGMALDMGCGRGDLIGYLLERHRACGSDQSPESVAEVSRKFDGHPRFHGAFVGTHDLPDAMADTVFLIEVVEHLDDETLGSVLSEARRLLKARGHLIITTPNNENLDASKILCPECACVFHRWQHVRSWTPQSLMQHLARFGFQGSAVATMLSHHAGPKRIAHKILHRLRGHPLPHMVYIGGTRD